MAKTTGERLAVIEQRLDDIDCKMDTVVNKMDNFIDKKADKCEVTEVKSEIKNLTDKQWGLLLGVLLALVTAIVGFVMR